MRGWAGEFELVMLVAEGRVEGRSDVAMVGTVREEIKLSRRMKFGR